MDRFFANNNSPCKFAVLLKGACAHSDIFSLLTDWPWPLRHILYNFTSRLLLTFSPGAKVSMWHWRWGCCKIHKKMKIGRPIPKIQCIYLFYQNFQSIVNLKLKFWVTIKKNMDFHLTPKKTTSGWALGHEKAMCSSYFKIRTVPMLHYIGQQIHAAV